jgi:hypothetical protein
LKPGKERAPLPVCREGYGKISRPEQRINRIIDREIRTSALLNRFRLSLGPAENLNQGDIIKNAIFMRAMADDQSGMMRYSGD